jgi:hypothetical protein
LPFALPIFRTFSFWKEFFRWKVAAEIPLEKTTLGAGMLLFRIFPPPLHRSRSWHRAKIRVGLHPNFLDFWKKESLIPWVRLTPLREGSEFLHRVFALIAHPTRQKAPSPFEDGA